VKALLQVRRDLISLSFLIRVYLRSSAVPFQLSAPAAATASTTAGARTAARARPARRSAIALRAGLPAAADAIVTARLPRTAAVSRSRTPVTDSRAPVTRASRAIAGSAVSLDAIGVAARDVLPPLLGPAPKLFAGIHPRPLPPAVFLLTRLVAILRSLAVLRLVLPIPGLDIGLVNCCTCCG
jgi:hypothetical protein